MCESMTPRSDTMTSRPETRLPPASPDAPLDPLTERALEWLVHLHSGTETDQDWSDYQDWKTANAPQRRAADEAERLWERLGSALARKPRSKLRRISQLSMVLVALAATSFAAGLFGAPASYFPDERTAVGELRTLTLPDGSRLELDSDSRVDIDFTDRRRRVVLYGGRIFVTVAPDRSRPFFVEAGGGTTRALGTAFAVGKDGDGVDVVVTEHAVRVAYPDGESGPSVEVRAGNQVGYAPQTGLEVPHPVDLGSRTAWRRGLFLFDSRPLGSVVAEMERYRRGRIVIAEEALKQLPVTGIFETGDTDSLLDAVSSALPVQVHRLPWLTVIRRDPARALEPFQPRR